MYRAALSPFAIARIAQEVLYGRPVITNKVKFTCMTVLSPRSLTLSMLLTIFYFTIKTENGKV